MPTLAEILIPKRLTEIVDVGSNPMGQPPRYAEMLKAGLCSVTGFEPHPDAFRELQSRQSRLERHLPYAVGDGDQHTLKLCQSSDMSSLLEPDPINLRLFDKLRPVAIVVGRQTVQTRRIDDITEIERMDLLKLDIQGGELAAIRGARSKLAHAVAVQAEVSFVTIYRDQPPFGAVDLELRSQGFMFHCFAAGKMWPIAPMIVGGNPYQPLNQMLEADAVYVRDIANDEGMDAEQLKHLALVAHHCYKSFDLALRCILILENRGALPPGSQERYLAEL